MAIIFISFLSSRSLSSLFALSRFLRRVLPPVPMQAQRCPGAPGWDAGRVSVSAALLSPWQHLAPTPLRHECLLSVLPVFSSADAWKAGSLLSLKSQILVVALLESSFLLQRLLLLFYLRAHFISFCRGFPNVSELKLRLLLLSLVSWLTYLKP